jgi:hypothetical protein
MGVVLKNNVVATLAAAIDTTTVSLLLKSGTGANFPALASGDYYYLTIVSGSSAPEIVKCTGRNGDTLTVVRAQESTVAQEAAANSRVELRVTAQSVIDSITANVGLSTALATNATEGFLYVPTCAGVPTGTPASYGSKAAMVVDTTNNRLYFYSGGSWRNAGP